MPSRMAAQDIGNSNVLKIEKFTAPRSQNVAIPVYLDNMDEITAVEFTLSAPAGVTFSSAQCVLTDRASDHTSVSKALTSTSCKVMIYSPTNAKLSGQSGLLVSVPAAVSTSLADNAELELTLSDVIVCVSNGDNVITEVRNGTLTIESTPDLVPSAISVSKQSVMPGDTITVSWTVDNIGEAATTSGWKEEVYLIGNGSTRKYLGSTYHQSVLGASGRVSRSLDIILPQILGLDGEVLVAVKLIPDADTGESVSAQSNNMAVGSDSPVELGKRLYVEFPGVLSEGADQNVPARLLRSGYWDEEQTFEITVIDSDSRLVLPQEIVIPRNKSAVYFQASFADNSALDLTDKARFSIAGAGYDPVDVSVEIVDDEVPVIDLSSPITQIVEGDTLKLHIALPLPVKTDTKVILTNNAPGRFIMPENVIVPAGESSVIVAIPATDNNTIDGDRTVLFRAAAPLHVEGEITVDLLDNDIPTLELDITPATISEGAGLNALHGTINRLDNFNSKVTIMLTDNSGGQIYYPTKTIEMASGVRSATFDLGVIDNDIVEGDRDIELTAAIWISSCNCAASGVSAGIVKKTIEVVDDDGPSLTIMSSRTTILEGNAEGLTLTVGRNTDTSSALVVNLSSDAGERLSYPATVTIPAGQKSVDVKIIAPANEVANDSKTVVITASASGYAKATFWAMITDQTLPDATITGIKFADRQVALGQNSIVTVELTNSGVVDLPAMTKTTVYLSNAPVAHLFNQEPVAPGSTVVLTKEAELPRIIGNFTATAKVNENKSVAEILYTNNSSAPAQIAIVSPWQASVATDKPQYSVGEAITITGQLTGDSDAQTDVEIYVMNEGSRQTLTSRTDNRGSFSATYQPYASQMGQFQIGACYPGENLRTPMADFYINGLRLKQSAAETCDLTEGELYSGSFILDNPGAVALTGLKAEIISKPENCELSLQCPTTIAGGSTATLGYKLTGLSPTSGNDWQQIKILVSSAEGIEITATIYYYCRTAKAELIASISELTTNLTAGVTLDYPFTIVNNGRGATGKVSLALPAWMKSATPIEMASMEPGDSATIVLKLRPDDQWNLNMPVSGQLGVNCENGKGIALRYKVTPVTDERGSVLVEACDEYTYNTAEAPRVSDATVIITHPSSGQRIYYGQTDENGQCSLDLPAGYYRIDVSADRHKPFGDYFYVSPGETTKVTADISYNPITVTWNVVETEVEDEYSIQTTVDYETNVPMPVVKMDMPDSIDGDNMAVGDATIINVVLTNIGLIKATNVRLHLPTVEATTEWQFEDLVHQNEAFDLLPMQSMVIPVKITRVADESTGGAHKVQSRDVVEDMDQTFKACMTHLVETYEAICGTSINENVYAKRLAMKMCAYVAPMTAIWNLMSAACAGIPSLPPIVPDPIIDDPKDKDKDGTIVTPPNPTPTRTLDICDPCDAEIAERIIDKLIDKTPAKYANRGINYALDQAGVRPDSRDENTEVYLVLHETGETLIKMGLKEYLKARESMKGDHIDLSKFGISSKTIDGLGDVLDLAIDVYEIMQPCEADKNKNESTKKIQGREADRGWRDEFKEVSNEYIDQLQSMVDFYTLCFGDTVWTHELDQEKIDFLEYALALPVGDIPDDEELQAHKPESVTLEQCRAYVDLLNGHTDAEAFWESLDSIADKYTAGEEKAKAAGFEDTSDQWEHSFADYKQHYEEMKSGSVCASISLQISQKLVMARQAFRGTLTVYNGHESKPMKDVKLNLVVRDSKGNIAGTREFAITAEKLSGFAGNLDLTSGWELNAGENGVATVLFVPSKYAAPDADVVYSFGGTLTYIDPYTDLEVTRTLYPIELTVKPAPVLDLIYFLQRNVYADDPLTPDVVEKEYPAEFALIITNKGNGNANKVRMITEQPQIIDNEKGLLIDFELLSSQLNGQEKTLALGNNVATDFGLIEAKSSVYAQWWLRSSVLGHFSNYNVEATHVTDYNNPDMSLLDNVSIHELTHGMTCESIQRSAAVRAFVVNDVADAENEPDMVYFSDGREKQPMSTASETRFVPISETESELSVTPSEKGWTYATTTYSHRGNSTLVKAVRKSDNREIPVDNIWFTDVTLRDGKEPLREKRIHFAADLSGAENYVLTFENEPEQRLEVEEFIGLPASDKPMTEQLKSLTVKFNKPIDPATFTANDITLLNQGESIKLTGIVITPESATEFKIDLSNVTLSDGYYVMTVKTDSIKDTEGFAGIVGKNCSWIQYVDGKVQLSLQCQPADGGSLNSKSGRYDYGSALTVTATPADGYEFSHWMSDGVIVQTAPSIHLQLDSEMNYTAVFTLKRHEVSVEYDSEMGHVVNGASGIYDHGTQLNMTAIPHDGHKFEHWTVNDQKITEPDLQLDVVAPTNIKAHFSLETTALTSPTVNDFRIEPLPLHDVMTVNGPFEKMTVLSVIDMTGRTVKYWKNMPAGVTVDVLNIPEGFYIVRVVSESGLFIKKVFKR